MGVFLLPARQWVSNWTPESITAASTVALAFLTLVLAMGTLFLWLATRRLVRGSEQTAKWQLRAYISLYPKNVLEFGEGLYVRIVCESRNIGMTPALNVKSYAHVAILDFPLPNNFDAPPLINENTKSGHVVFPRGVDTQTATIANPLTASEIANIIRGDKVRLCILATITYEDVFGDSHETEVCCFDLMVNRADHYKLAALPGHLSNHVPRTAARF